MLRSTATTDSEKTNNMQPIYPHDISISPTGHVLLTLDTRARSGPGEWRARLANVGGQSGVPAREWEAREFCCPTGTACPRWAEVYANAAQGGGEGHEREGMENRGGGRAVCGCGMGEQRCLLEDRSMRG